VITVNQSLRTVCKHTQAGEKFDQLLDTYEAGVEFYRHHKD